MLRNMKKEKSSLTKKDLNYLGFINSNDIDILLSPEQNLSNIISANVYFDNLKHIAYPELIYGFLMKIQNFHEFILLNDIDRATTLNMLKTGILTLYRKGEVINKKDKQPKEFFLLLVGTVSYLNDSTSLLKPGSFFGYEIISNIRYKHTIIANSEKVVCLLISKEFINEYITDKIILANENIKKCIEDSINVFKNFDKALFRKYFEKIIKLFPKIDDTIISQNEKADSIFIIYNGICVLNNGHKEDLIKLDKGDIIGIESLSNIDQEGNIMDNKYLYNLINKSYNTIIFKIPINELNLKMINDLKLQLESYFEKRNDIISKNEKMLNIRKKRLMENYRLFQKKENINEYISHSMIRKFTPEKAELFFNRALKRIRLNEQYVNDKQRLSVKTCLYRNIIKKNNLLKRTSGSKSTISFKEINSKNIVRKYASLSNLLKKGKILNPKLSILNSKKLFENKEEKCEKCENNINNNNNNNNYKAERKYSAISSDNSINNSIFFTAINENKSIYKRIAIKGKNIESILFSNRLRKKSNNLKETSFVTNNERNYNKLSFLPSTNKDSFSFKILNRSMSAKRQMETYGCTILDKVNYFNFGDKEKSKADNNQDKNNSKCLYYESINYNLPLFIFCESKKLIKFPGIN